MTTAQTSPSDGRVRRSERSREAIVQSMLELVGEGVTRPTAEQVAQRAGVVIRTVFRHFSDMESLFAALTTRIATGARPLLIEDPPNAGVVDRVHVLVRNRAKIFERILPYKRAANAQRWRSPFFQHTHANLVAELRAHLMRWFPELAAVSPGLADALELVTSFEAWDRLRSDQQLGRGRATAAMIEAATAVVAQLDD
jgi:AcrR family transcriptional regulator